ncbi:DUF6701 domain-containing protein [Aeromonas caviae]|uniref:DUF6701 domain-containing protein n=1 Tax=Aeromonas caviae TaxID=648 RepID=UPI00249BD0E0|nr:DUF6701 domain-containing protein [Aeromonas caviae]WGY77515.1 MSHA biogenesis protein MshQ [Aeromonas caviae]
MSRWLIMLVLSVAAPMAWGAFDTIDTGEVFPAVVQGHHGNNNNSCHQISGDQLYQVNNPKINGTGGKALNFCSINKDQNNTPRCDNGVGGYQVCQITQTDIRGLKMDGSNQFPSIKATNTLYCQSGQQTVSSDSYGSITAENCTLTFPSRSQYLLKNLTLRNNATILIGEGDYYIDQLTIDNATIKLTGSGLTRIFVNNDVRFVNNVDVNEDNKGSLIWVNYNNMVLDSSTKFYGYLYTDEKLTMNNTATIYGRVTTRYLSMDAQSSINDNVITPPLSCFNDDFSASTLSNSWVVASSSGNFTPSIVNGRLGMTQASPKQSTSATYQRLFPAANNLVTIEFDHYAHGGNGADGMAVVLSDATITPQPGAFGGPLGYGFKTGISGFAGGWMGVGIDEYGNYANEGGSYNPGSRPQAVSIRGSGASSGTSGYRYLAGTASNLSPAVDSGTNGNRPHRYRITIDSRTAGSSLASVERNTGLGYTMLVGPINMVNQMGQAAVPANFLLSLTGSTGSVTNYHELDNVRICALKSNPVGTQIDHFEFDHSGQALTCNPETLTIRACANASCSQLFTDPVSAILTPLKNGSNGWIAGSQVSYNGNTATVNFSGGTTTVQLRNNLATAITVGVSGSTPSTKPLSTTLCRAGSGALSAAACTLSFADSGFVFNVLDTDANKPQDVVISAVKKDDVTKLCVPGFASVSKPVSVWGSYVTPNANAFGSQVTIDGNSVSTYAANMASPAGTVINLNFDSQGKATLKKVNYPDAGQMRLNARHDGSGDTAGLVMTGSDLFVSRPAGLCITPTQGTCAAGDASCPVFKKTGEAFQLNIKGVAWQADDDKDLCSGNLATPNFALANIALGSELVAPKPGVEAVVGKQNYDHAIAAGSINTMTQSLNEVGVFRMTATPPTLGYFGYTIPAASSVPVGRFVPWDFNLMSSDVVPACEDMTAPERDFTYMSQPFGIELEVVARNMAGGQTQNYTGLFAKGEAYITTANNKDGNSLSSRLRSLQPLPWLNGRAAFTGTSEFVRLSDTQPDGPYKSLLFGLYMRDNDGDHSLIASPNFNDAVVGDCNGSGCNARLLDSVPMQAYFGRLLASTRQGVASAPLALPLQVQYFEGGGWKINQADVCTQLSLANNGFDPATILDPTRKISFNNGSYEVTGQVPGTTPPQSFRSTLTLSGLAAPASVATANKGEILFHFSALVPVPNKVVGIPYKVELSKQPSRPLWLSDPLTQAGEAIFGSTRGNDRIIYRREVMP